MNWILVIWLGICFVIMLIPTLHFGARALKKEKVLRDTEWRSMEHIKMYFEENRLRKSKYRDLFIISWLIAFSLLVCMVALLTWELFA